MDGQGRPMIGGSADGLKQLNGREPMAQGPVVQGPRISVPLYVPLTTAGLGQWPDDLKKTVEVGNCGSSLTVTVLMAEAKAKVRLHYSKLRLGKMYRFERAKIHHQGGLQQTINSYETPTTLPRQVKQMVGPRMMAVQWLDGVVGMYESVGCSGSMELVYRLKSLELPKD